MTRPSLIVMLTYHDRTVMDAAQIFEQCRNSPAQYWGFKEEGLPMPQMKALFSTMKELGKKTVLEVVAYTETECLEAARIAIDCGCDILMGTLYFDSVRDLCKAHGLQYMPFVGTVSGRPSVLSGTVEQIVAQAHQLLQKGVDGFDLLGYRYTEDPTELIRQFVAQVPAPVCVAGSINSYERLDEICEISPWAFTVGGAFFENRFGETFSGQVETVTRYVAKEPQYV